MKRLSPAAIIALQEAAAVVYHYKKDLRRFLEIALGDRTLTARFNWSDPDIYKRTIVAELIGILTDGDAAHTEALTKLCYAITEMRDFSHLEQLDDGKKKAKEARDAVKRLRELVDTHRDTNDEELARQERVRRDSERQHHNAAIRSKLEELKASFFSLLATSGAEQQRGYLLEKLLRGLFELHDLDPRASFKLSGEQIDGAFKFDGVDFICEARWTKDPQDAGDLNEFDGKVRSRLDNTLGLFISINGFSSQALPAFSRGGRPRLFLMDGSDLMAVLESRIELTDLLHRKKQHAARTGEIFLAASKILSS